MLSPPSAHLLAALGVSFGLGWLIAPALPPIFLSVQRFGVENTACARWSDACVICQRGGDGVGKCSLPGIACVAGPTVCQSQVVKP